MTDSAKPDLDQWRSLAAKELKGADPETLTWRTLEGIAVKPLYTEADTAGLGHMGSLPGLAPFTTQGFGEVAPLPRPIVSPQEQR